MTERLIDALAAIVGSPHILVDPGLTASYSQDWTGRFEAFPLAVVRPGDPEEVARILTECSAAGVPVVPQGGNTGLVGGAMPRGGDVVLSTRRLKWIGELDMACMSITVGSGVTLAELQAHLEAHGCMLAVDISSRESATIGGMVATNAGGQSVLRYGMMSRQVLGLQAVLPTGIRLGRETRSELKNNAGYQLERLLIGSEGTLGIITSVEVAVAWRPANAVCAVIGLPSYASMAEAVRALRSSVSSLAAAEFITHEGLTAVCEAFSLRPLLSRSAPLYLLADATGHSDASADLMGALSSYAETGIAVLSQDSRQRRSLFAYRDFQTDAVARLGTVHKFDLSVPLSTMDEFDRVARSMISGVDNSAKIIAWGHAAESNIHLNIVSEAHLGSELATKLYKLAHQYGGNACAEHGIGALKAQYLALERSPAELKLFQAVKQAYDPERVLNPGVLLHP